MGIGDEKGEKRVSYCVAVKGRCCTEGSGGLPYSGPSYLYRIGMLGRELLHLRLHSG